MTACILTDLVSLVHLSGARHSRLSKPAPAKAGGGNPGA